MTGLDGAPGTAPIDYEVFGLRVRSAIPLPDLLAASADGEPDVTVSLGPIPPPPVGAPTVWGLTGDGGRAVLTVADVARFAIVGGREVLVDPAPTAPAADVRLFLLGSAMGALLHQRGLLPLHANAVGIGEGAAAFAGASGAGKSTLAAAFLDRGFPLLADDVCAVRFDEGGRALAYPGLPRLRLWRDAVEASGRDADALELAMAGHQKYVVPTQAGQAREALPLRRIYLLEQMEQGATGQRIRRLAGVEAMSAVMANIYRGHYLQVLGGGARNYRDCLRLVRTVPVFAVQRQWGHDVMDEQIRALERHAKEDIAA